MFNIPNLLTLFRLILVPVFLYLLSLVAVWAPWACLGIGLLMSLTDILDGYLSRKLGQITDLGKVFDPTVDKIAGISMVAGLYFFRGLPLAFVIFKAGKEFLMLVRGIIIVRKWSNIPSANRWGKTAFVLLFISMVPFVLDILPEVRMYFLLAAALAEFAALLSYYVELFTHQKT